MASMAPMMGGGMPPMPMPGGTAGALVDMLAQVMGIVGGTAASIDAPPMDPAMMGVDPMMGGEPPLPPELMGMEPGIDPMGGMPMGPEAPMDAGMLPPMPPPMPADELDPMSNGVGEIDLDAMAASFGEGAAPPVPEGGIF